MNKAKVLIEDALGNIISEHTYNLGNNLDNLSEIEASIFSEGRETSLRLVSSTK